MLITLNIFCDYIRKRGWKPVLQESGGHAFRQVSPIMQTIQRPDFLYIEKLPSCSAEKVCVIHARGSAVTAGAEDSEGLFLLAQDCLAFYDDWDILLQDCLHDGGTIADLLELSRDIFVNPILIDDTCLRTIALSRRTEGQIRPADSEAHYMREHGTHSPEYVANMLANPVFRSIASIPGYSVIHLYDFLSNPCAMTPITAEGQLMGYFTVVGLDSELTGGTIDLSRYFAKVAARLIRQKKSASGSGEAEPGHDLLRDIVTGRIRDTAMIAAVFEKTHVPKSGPYSVVRFSIKEPTPDDGLWLQRICDIIALRLKPCAAVTDEHGIIIVLGFDEKDAEEILADICDEVKFLSACRMGQSLPFDHLSDLSEYYRQAEMAVHIGSALFPQTSVYRYSDITDYDLMEHFGSPNELMKICNPCIAVLEAFDERENGHLMETVRVLMECGGDTKAAAERLFLHRNSLYYRLNQIAGLTGIDLRDGRSIRSLELSLKIRDYCLAFAP